MYKIQLTFQKIICYLAVVAGALSFLYSLGLVTDLYDSFYYTIPRPDKLDRTYVTGSRILYDIQGFNQQLLIASIVLLLLAVLLFLTQTHARRKYYIGNYVSTALFSVGAVALAVWSYVEVSAYRTQYLTTVNFEELKSTSESMASVQYIESTFWFDLQYVLAAVLIVAAVLLVVNIVWKRRLMKAESQLIAETAEK